MPNNKMIFEEIIQNILNCNRCELHDSAKNYVPGEGNLQSRVVLIGEAPGKKEDEFARPFVGSAGKLLNQLLEGSGIDRDKIYITNIVKCRPPNNRSPRKAEINECSTHLEAQLRFIKPETICPMGNNSVNYLLKKFGLEIGTIGELHGKKFKTKADWGDIFIMPLYHPAAAIYDRRLLPQLVKDMRKLKTLMDTP